MKRNTSTIQFMKTILVDEWKKCLVKSHKIHSVLRVDSVLICNIVGVQGYFSKFLCFMCKVNLSDLKKQDENIGKP